MHLIFDAGTERTTIKSPGRSFDQFEIMEVQVEETREGLCNPHCLLIPTYIPVHRMRIIHFNKCRIVLHLQEHPPEDACSASFFSVVAIARNVTQRPAIHKHAKIAKRRSMIETRYYFYLDDRRKQTT